MNRQLNRQSSWQLNWQLNWPLGRSFNRQLDSLPARAACGAYTALPGKPARSQAKQPAGSEYVEAATAPSR